MTDLCKRILFHQEHTIALNFRYIWFYAYDMFLSYIRADQKSKASQHSGTVIEGCRHFSAAISKEYFQYNFKAKIWKMNNFNKQNKKRSNETYFLRRNVKGKKKIHDL